MDLTTYRMGLIQRSNDPEIIAGLAEKGYAFPYAKFLLSGNHEIPKVILDAVAEHPLHSAEIAVKMKLRNMEVPEAMISSIAEDPDISVNYAVRLFSSKREVEPEVMTAIVRRSNSCKAYVKKAIDININIPIPKSILECIQDDPRLCLALAKEYLKQGKKDYNELDRSLIDAIASDHYTAENFAHFLQPYVEETPEEILNAIQNHEKIRKKWHKGSGDENFAKFFRARNA
jgi:hypothetical protein